MLLNASVLGMILVDLVLVAYEVVVETSVALVGSPTNIHDRGHPLLHYTVAVRCYDSGSLANDTNFFYLYNVLYGSASAHPVGIAHV